MPSRAKLFFASSFALVALLAACGGSGDDTAEASPTGAGGGASGGASAGAGGGAIATAGSTASMAGAAGKAGQGGGAGSPVSPLGGSLGGSPGAAGSAGVSAGGAVGNGGNGGEGGAVGNGGEAGAGGAVAMGGSPPVLTPVDIDFKAISPVPSGESILFNDWAKSPNPLVAIRPDGSGRTVVLEAYRLWSVGADGPSQKVAFSCGDPKQVDHYGINIGDAIQHTWLYDMQTEQLTGLSTGNVNDECHRFVGGSLYLCRRYDFTDEGTFKGWRLGRIALATGAFEFLSPEVEKEFALSPSPTADETTLYYHRIQIMGTKQVSAVMKKALPDGDPEVFKGTASNPVLSPDGARYVYADLLDQSALYEAPLAGGKAVRVTSQRGTSVAYSPDGTQVAFLTYDDSKGCSHLEVAKVDGSEVDKPRRLVDCGETGEFISDLSWVARPLAGGDTLALRIPDLECVLPAGRARRARSRSL